jgi:hypothetical protein
MKDVEWLVAFINPPGSIGKDAGAPRAGRTKLTHDA